MTKLFIIDDDPINNFLSKKSIERSGSQTHISTFTDPVQAVNTLNEQPYDPTIVLLLDLNMPEMSGWEVIETLKHPYHVYILTSSISALDMEKCGNYSNISGFISKPLTPQTSELVISKTNLFTHLRAV